MDSRADYFYCIEMKGISLLSFLFDGPFVSPLSEVGRIVSGFCSLSTYLKEIVANWTKLKYGLNLNIHV